MSGAASVLAARGVDVAGSDRQVDAATRTLGALGLGCAVGTEDAALPEGVDLVVRSAAIQPSHPQWQAAKTRGVPVWRYAELVGALMSDRWGIAVAGCHGKTTTTSFLAHVLMALGEDPSFLVGGTLQRLRVGQSRGSRTALCGGVLRV